MKREKRLTKKEQKSAGLRATQVDDGPRHHHHHEHIHCTACGKHLDGHQFESDPPSAVWVRCEHGTEFACCTGCTEKTRELLAEHDRTGQPVKQAAMVH